MEDLEFDQKIKEIMIHRKPEFWLDDIFSNLVAYTSVNYPNETFYKKEDVLLLNYDKFQINYNYIIYMKLRDNYHMNVNDIHIIMKFMVKKYFKLNVKINSVTWMNLKELNNDLIKK